MDTDKKYTVKDLQDAYSQGVKYGNSIFSIACKETRDELTLESLPNIVDYYENLKIRGRCE